MLLKNPLTLGLCPDVILSRSLAWVIGVWVCVVGMVPASIAIGRRLHIFGLVNVIFFSAVLFTVVYFHPAMQRRAKPK
jgi:hypothetical protein